MALYRITTGRPPAKAFAVRAGNLGGQPVVNWSARKGAAALFSRKEAAAIARRMRRIRIRTTLEAA